MGRHREIAERFKARRPDLAELPMPAGITSYWASSLNWPEWLWEGTDLRPGEVPGDYLDAGDDLRMIANLIDHVGDQELLRMLCDWPFVPREDLVYNAPDLSSSLEALANGISNTNPLLHLTVCRVPDGLDVEMELIADLAELRGFIEMVTLIFLVRVVGAFQGFAKGQEPQEQLPKVQVVYAETSLIDLMTALLGIAFERSSDATVLHVPQGSLVATNPAYKAEKWDAIVASLASNPRIGSRRIPLSSTSLRAFVRNSLKTKGRVPHMSELANARGMSLRSFAREMSSRGISLRDLINSERMALSRDGLRDPQASVESVATSLGYSESSSFVRAFRKNFGVTPSEWRRTRGAGWSG